MITHTITIFVNVLHIVIRALCIKAKKHKDYLTDTTMQNIQTGIKIYFEKFSDFICRFYNRLGCIATPFVKEFPYIVIFLKLRGIAAIWNSQETLIQKIGGGGSIHASFW